MKKIVVLCFALFSLTACKNKEDKKIALRDDLDPVQHHDKKTDAVANATQKQDTESQYSADEMTQITFEETNYDFGEIPKKGGKVSHWYSFTNTGNKPLIVSVKPHCGCTVGDAPDAPIAPGKSDSIRLEFNPSNFSGKKTKSAAVSGNFEKPITLRFSAEITE